VAKGVDGMVAAVIVCPRGESSPDRLGIRLGGLSLVKRCLLAVRHAGFERVLVLGDPGQREALAAHWVGDPRLDAVRWLEPEEALGRSSGRCLLLLPEVVLTSGDLRAWVASLPMTALASAPDAGGHGPVALSPELLSAAIAAARGGTQHLAAHLAGLARAGRLEEVPWRGCVRDAVESPADVPRVERKLLRALRTPDDGPVVDRFVNRTISGWLSPGLVKTPVTPNQVTVASLLTGLVGAWVLGSESWLASFCGLLLFQASVILDHVDGELARLKYQFSAFGKWLDNWSDHVVDLAVVGMLTWRAAESGGGALIGLGIAAAVGVTGSFLLVFRWSLVPEAAAARPPGLDSLANRDGFCLALWGTMLLGRPAWFLWALGLGANLFWMLWLLRAGLPPRTGR
jgi:phosphatidylglycerophosphate synthase